MAIGYSISWPGMSPTTTKGTRASGGRQRGHQDRRQPLSRPAQDQPGTESLAFIALEMLTVVDQKNAVARRNAEHREKADQRPE